MNYTVYVLILRDTKDIENEVLGLMDEYGEHNELEIDQIRCNCVDLEVRKKLNEIVQRDFGEPRILWKHRMGGEEICNSETVWNEILFDLNRFERAHLNSVLETCPPNPDCDECGGTGWITTTFDFESRWDGWEWDPFSPFKNELEPESQEETEYQPRVYDLRDIDISRFAMPAAILSPFGWQDHEIWRRYDSIPLPEELWEQIVQVTLETHKEDYLMIPVVCHV